MSGARAAENNQAAESPLAARRWTFAAAVLDERALTLRVHGEAVELERKPLEVLLHLLHHAGEVVTKDELLASVWPGRVLSDSALTSCMHKLREALRDDAQEIIRTQHGYGYRLVAPVKVEVSAAPAAARFDFKPGDRPPLRPQWSLQRRLGAGSHGEAWLARHDKTREARVFKFAADSESLSSLKREITLSRLLHDALGGRADMVRVLDWNLEEAPYFVESAYSADGSLVDWAAAQGGLQQVPLATRVDLAAQVAEALAAAHSVGVLHKDLKPSNVLIDAADGPPRVRLSDFGSGGVLDVDRLEALGITRLGFTQAAPAASGGGTPLYLAPEVIAGQPFTLQSDIYALGVVLYQLVVGDCNKPLAPGWERDIDDELLREDIAHAAEGHPDRRLGDAAQLAHRLRTLDRRRGERAAQRRASAEADAAKLEFERIRARRKWVLLAISASVTGVVVSLLLLVGALRARDQAQQAAATSKAVSDFLNKDVFAFITAGGRPLRNIEVKQLLDAAAAQVSHRFAQRGEVAAEVHASLGGSYYALEFPAEATRELDQALSLYREAGKLGSAPALEAAGMLVTLKYVGGDLEAAWPLLEEAVRAGEREFGARDIRVLRLHERMAYGHFVLHQWDRAVGRYRQVLEALGGGKAEGRFASDVEKVLAHVLASLGDFAGAEHHARRAHDRLRALGGDDDAGMASVRAVLANVLTELGRYEEADALLAAAVEREQRLAVNEESARLLSMRQAVGRLRLEQERFKAAAALLEDVLAKVVRFEGIDQSAETRYLLGLAYHGQRRLEDSAAMLQAALASASRNPGPHSALSQRIRIGLADVLRELRQIIAAREMLGQVDLAPTLLPEGHPAYGDLRRVEGLLLLAEGDRRQGRERLEQSLGTIRRHYPPGHWRIRRGELELRRAGAG